jgi:hypothetical protein
VPASHGVPHVGIVDDLAVLDSYLVEHGLVTSGRAANGGRGDVASSVMAGAVAVARDWV